MKPKLDGWVAIAGAVVLVGGFASRAEGQAISTVRRTTTTQSHPCVPERVRVYSDDADRGAERSAVEGHDRTILWTGDNCFVLIRMAGTVTFNASSDDVEMVEEGGRLEVMFEQGSKNGRYLVTNSAGRTTRSYIENGRAVSAIKTKAWRTAMIRTLLVSPKLRNSFPDRPEPETESMTRVSDVEEEYEGFIGLERWACDDPEERETPPIIAQRETSR